MQSYETIILGGGVAAGYAAKEFVKRGIVPGELAIISAESAPPYQRPYVTKEYFSGDETLDELLINPRELYTENGINLLLDTVIASVDLAGRVLRARDGTEFSFEKLVIATGTRVRRLPVPGADLEGLFYVRTTADVDAIRAYAANAKRAVVIGGSFIGMESTAELTQLGLDVTMVFPQERVWQSFFTPEMADWFQRFYEGKGVTFVPNERASGIQGETRVSGVTLTSGKELPADLVIAGVGVVPNTDLFEGAGLEMDNGIVVNEYLETNVAGVYAVGDVARFYDPIAGRTRRFEHWDTARRQGRAVVGSIYGEGKPYKAVSYFYSDVFGLGWELWGDPDLADQIVYRGDVVEGAFTVWWLQETKLVAVFTFDPPQEGVDKLAPRWIRRRQTLSADDLRDASKPLGELVG